MRRSLVFVLLSLLVAAPAALAGVAPGDRSVDDGTLSVKRGKGAVGLNIRGAIIGRLDRGTVRAVDPDDTDGSGPVLKGCDRGSADISDKTADPDDVTILCSGTDIRFRLLGGGKYLLKIQGTGIFLSAVGFGRVFLDGRGDVTGGPDGVYSVNGGAYRSLPDEPTPFPLAAPNGD
jgi:hypothetical protein